MFRTLICTCRRTSIRSGLACLGLSALLLPSLSGCAIIAQVAQAFPAVEPAKYKKLAGESVAVMVWAGETGTRDDWPRITLDTADIIQQKLIKFQTVEKMEELKGTRFPVIPASIVRYQEEHPDSAGVSITEIAPNFGVTRLIYVEIRGFQTRPDRANDLFRGTVTGSVQVVEVINGKGRVTFTDDNIGVTFPRSSPEEGLPALGDHAVYDGVLQGFATEVAKRFLAHANDPDAEYDTISSGAH